jgi:hypothetical protein
MQAIQSLVFLVATAVSVQAQLAPSAVKPASKPAPAAPAAASAPSTAPTTVPAVPASTIRFYRARVTSVSPTGVLVKCSFPDYQRNPRGTVQHEVVGQFLLRGRGINTLDLSHGAEIAFYATEDGTYTYETNLGRNTVRALRYFGAKADWDQSPSPDIVPGKERFGETLLNQPARR